HVLPPIDADIAEPVHVELKKNGVRLVLGKGVGKIEGDAVVLDDGERVPAELVMLVVGVQPRTGLAKDAGLELGKNGVTVNAQMQTSDPDIYAVGDMVETEQKVTGLRKVLALAGPANRQGRMAADHIFGKDVSYRGNVGAAVVKVFGLTVGVTGLSVEGLRRLGIDPLWVSAHPPDHAGYYPGAHPITLKVAFEKGTGKILGAQGVGTAGVDKRIDVLSTAIQADMTVFDLEHLELCYAPPYGSAKDPINMVGFIGSNVLRGDVDIVHGQDLTPADLNKMQVVDVRSPGEFSRGHLKFAKNIPVNDLRGDMAELDKSKKTVVYCQVGYRGYLADRILKQKGFDVVNLDGGYKSVADAGLKDLQEVPQKSG
ncbi:FAD/NAD-linked reductase, partial [Podospora aff. communis PSN243]